MNSSYRQNPDASCQSGKIFLFVRAIPGGRRQQFVGKHTLHLHCGPGALLGRTFTIELARMNWHGMIFG
jgi:hypothetical protein